MTPEELEMLFAVFESGSLNEVDLLNRFHGKIPAKDAYEMLKRLWKDGFLHVDQERVVTLGKNGRSLVRQRREEIARRDQETAAKEAAEAKRIQERREDRADAERRYRGQNRIAVCTALLSFVLGMVAEHFIGIVKIVVGLFQ